MGRSGTRRARWRRCRPLSRFDAEARRARGLGAAEARLARAAPPASGRAARALAALPASRGRPAAEDRSERAREFLGDEARKDRADLRADVGRRARLRVGARRARARLRAGRAAPAALRPLPPRGESPLRNAEAPLDLLSGQSELSRRREDSRPPFRADAPSDSLFAQGVPPRERCSLRGDAAARARDRGVRRRESIGRAGLGQGDSPVPPCALTLRACGRSVMALRTSSQRRGSR